MKNIKSFLVLIICFVMAFSFACTTNNNDSQNNNSQSSSTPAHESSNPVGGEEGGDEEKPATYCNVLPISYDEVNKQPDMDAFYAETKRPDGSSWDAMLDYGFVDSVWHTLKVEGVSVPVYSARCGYGIHSFAWVDVDTDGAFELDVELTLTTPDTKESVVVLPEKLGVEASIQNNVATAKLCEYGSFSFAFNELPDNAITLYVAPKAELPQTNGMEKVEIEPGRYDVNETRFKQTNTIYYFKSGVFDLNSIFVPSDSIIYFEPGTYVRVYEDGPTDYAAAIEANSTKNSKIMGRALFDFSQCTGGDAKHKGVYTFEQADGLTVEGIITVNSNGWTMCSWYCKNVEISRCMFFSYRTYSDGIMFSDCQNSLAHDNFVRTGDDAIEVKAFSASTAEDCYTDNVLFEDNCVWTDKGIAYGAIYEARHEIKNVTFRNNSVGFAQASWSKHIGICTVQMGSIKGTKWHDIHFENIEVYNMSCALLSVFNRANNATEGGKIDDIYFNNITVKHTRKLILDPCCLSIVIILKNGAEWTNSTRGKMYIDNIDYCGTKLTAENYADYSRIEIQEEAKFGLTNIKINTLS